MVMMSFSIEDTTSKEQDKSKLIMIYSRPSQYKTRAYKKLPNQALLKMKIEHLYATPWWSKHLKIKSSSDHQDLEERSYRQA